MARKGFCKVLEIDTETQRTERERAINQIRNSTTFPNIEYQLE